MSGLDVDSLIIKIKDLIVKKNEFSRRCLYPVVSSRREKCFECHQFFLKLPGCIGKDTLFVALVHKSYAYENSGENRKLISNERLEFLGDAVLELVISEFLFNNYDLTEGEMSKARAVIGSETILSKVAQNIGLNNFFILRKG